MLTIEDRNATGKIRMADGFVGRCLLAICARCHVLDIHVQFYRTKEDMDDIEHRPSDFKVNFLLKIFLFEVSKRQNNNKKSELKREVRKIEGASQEKKSCKNGEKARESEKGVKAKSTCPDIAPGTQIHLLARHPSVMGTDRRTRR